MALIQCPECNKEISDKVKACPFCGFPFENQNDQSSNIQQVEIASVNIALKDPNKLKKVTVGVAVGVAILALFILTFSVIKFVSDRKEYNAYVDALHLAKETMLDGGAEAESLLNLTGRVWYNSIWEEIDPETDKYTMSGGYGFNEDFNTSLAALMLDSSTQATISRIEKNQSLIEPIMKALQNPP